MIVELTVWRTELQSILSEGYRLIEKMQPDTVGTVVLAFLGVEIVIGAPVVFVYIPSLDQYRLYRARKTAGKALDDILRGIFRRNFLLNLRQIRRRSKGYPCIHPNSLTVPGLITDLIIPANPGRAYHIGEGFSTYSALAKFTGFPKAISTLIQIVYA